MWDHLPLWVLQRSWHLAPGVFGVWSFWSHVDRSSAVELWQYAIRESTTFEPRNPP